MKALNKAPYENLILICGMQRPEGSEKPSCGYHGANELRAWLKSELKKEGLWGRKVRVAKTSCLDVCPHEGFILSFSNGECLTLANQDDRDEILQRIREIAQ